MRKLLSILAFICCLNVFGQGTTTSNEGVNITKLYEYPQAYFEFGLGGMIPTDDSNSYFGLQMEFGKYLNGIFGVGLELQTGAESEYHDHLSYIGLNTRYKLNPAYNPNKMIHLEASAGIGYGWYSYETGYGYEYYDYYYDSYYYDDYRRKFSYVVPKFGLHAYVDLARNCQIGLSPEFAWYISTNKDNSNNVGVINIFGKVRFTF